MIDDAREFTDTLRKEVYWGESWEYFLAQGKKVSDEKLQAYEAKVQFDDPVNIQYTSGTTGNPKGVTLTHHNILNNAYFIGVRMNYTDKDRVCIPVPFYHCFGMVIGNLCCTAHGATMVIPNDSFDATKTLEAVERESCTSLYGVPTMFISELYTLDRHPYDLSSLRTGVMAGALCPPEIMKRVKEQMNMHEITICYGMTETSPVSTQTRIGVPFEKQIHSVGTIQDHIEIKIINPETKAIVPRGESGELIEDFLYTYKGVMDAQVIGVPSKKFGEEVMAWIKPNEGVTLTEEELRNFCKDRIAHYKVPRYWKFVNEFPMTISGKIRKVEMREIAAEELGLQLED